MLDACLSLLFGHCLCLRGFVVPYCRKSMYASLRFVAKATLYAHIFMCLLLTSSSIRTAMSVCMYVCMHRD